MKWLVTLVSLTLGTCALGACAPELDALASDPTDDAPALAQTAAPAYPYVFSTFNNTAKGNTTLLIYTSTDALNFRLLLDTKFGGNTGTLRDPSIMKHSDGRYYAAYTTPPTPGCCAPQSSFSIAVSSDLRRWTTVATIPSGVSGTYNTWAPEFFRDSDGSVHVIASVSTSAPRSFRAFRYTARDATLSSWSGPTPLGIGPNYIDTFLVKVGATYHAFTKNETTLFIEHATSSTMTGPWTFVGQGDWAGWGGHREGPSLLALPKGGYRIYLDGYSNVRLLYSDSYDGFKTWTAPKPLPNIGNQVSHGTVISGG